jgi:DnaK suppressor protein
VARKTTARTTRKKTSKAGTGKVVKKPTGKSTAKKTTKKKTTKKTGRKSAAAKTSKKTSAKKVTKKKTAGKVGKKTSKKVAAKKTTKKKVAKKTAPKKTTKKRTATKVGRKTSKKASAAASGSKKEVPRKKTGQKTVKVESKKRPGRKKKVTKAVEARPEIPSSGSAVRQLSQAVSRTPATASMLRNPTSEQAQADVASTIPADASANAAPLVRRKLGKRDLERFRKLLLAKRAELLEDVTSMQSDALGSGSQSELSHTPQHMADQGTDNFEKEFTLGLVAFERKMLREIEEALERIAAGTYGVCQMTGVPISMARLDAKPWAKYSIEAARQLERMGRL